MTAVFALLQQRRLQH